MYKMSVMRYIKPTFLFWPVHFFASSPFYAGNVTGARRLGQMKLPPLIMHNRHDCGKSQQQKSKENETTPVNILVSILY